MKGKYRFRKEEKAKRNVPFLPNFITTMSLFCGFYSISFSLKGNFYMAAVLILIAGFIDGIDGRVARATNSTSAFGKEYDSLSDLVAFGVSPAIMGYLWQVNQFDRLGFIAAFLFCACGALRLARFNTDVSGDNRTFTGLPIPVAAGALSSIVLFTDAVGDFKYVDLSGIMQYLSLAVLFAMYALSFLMVSTVRYPSFKHVSYIKAHPFQLLVAGLLLLAVVAYKPEVMIFVLAMTFIVGGPILNAIAQARVRAREQKQMKGVEHEHVTREDHNI